MMTNADILIEVKDIKWITRHTMDAIGFCFIYRGDFYRLIYPDKIPFMKKLLDDESIQQAINNGFLPQTKIMNHMSLRGYEDYLILWHERNPYSTVPIEWTEGMFRDALCFVVDFDIYLIEHGYELLDPHSQNVGFNGCNPMYYDFGSIVYTDDVGFGSVRSIETSWINFINLMGKAEVSWEFMQGMLISARLTTSDYYGIKNYGKIRSVLHKFYDKYLLRYWDEIHMANANFKDRKIKYLVNLGRKFVSSDSKDIRKRKIKILKSYKQRINRIKHSKVRTSWGDYQVDSYLFDDGTEMKNRFGYYIDYLKNSTIISPNMTMLELAGNGGVFSEWVIREQLFKRVCCSDYDSRAINQGYDRCKKDSLISRYLSFCVFDLLNNYKDIFNNREERMESDVVVMFAATHHLLLTQRIRLDVLVDILSKYTRRMLITEFMPLGLWDGNYAPPVPNWYNLEWFLAGLKEKFNVIDVKKLSPNRIGIIGEKRE